MGESLGEGDVGNACPPALRALKVGVIIIPKTKRLIKILGIGVFIANMKPRPFQ